MSKLSFLAGVGVGYVLGARAGRERYEQIRSGARGAWNNPKVQETVSHGKDYAAQKAPEVQHKLVETASSAVHKVTDKVGSGEGAREAERDTPSGFVENPAN